MKPSRPYRVPAILLATLAVSFAAAGALAGQPPVPPPPGMHGGPMGPGGMHGPMVLGHASELGLAPEQIDTIKGIYKGAHPAMEQMHAQMRTQMDALRLAKPSDANYATVVAQAAQSIGELTSQSIVQESQVRAQVWNALTAAQRDKLAALEAQAHAEGHGPHGPDGPPPAN